MTSDDVGETETSEMVVRTSTPSWKRQLRSLREMDLGFGQNSDFKGEMKKIKHELCGGEKLPDVPRTGYVRIADGILLVTYLLVTAFVGYVIYRLATASDTVSDVGVGVASIFVAITLPLSFNDIHMHFAHYVSPLQRYYIRILLMVPIYSIESWFALQFRDQRLWFQVGRETYEAYTIFNFYMLLLDFLGGRHALKVTLSQMNRNAYMIFPCCCLRPWKMGPQFISRTSFGVYQYTVLRLLLSVLTIIASYGGWYGEGNYDWSQLYPWNVFIINASQCWAIYCLIIFYAELQDLLRPIRPLGKFITVKLVVFFSWYQGIIIGLLVTFGAIRSTLNFTQDELASFIQDFLVVIEMAFAAVAHHMFFRVGDLWHRDADVDLSYIPAPDHETGGDAFHGDYTEAPSGEDKPPQGHEHSRKKRMIQALKDVMPIDIIQETGQRAVKAGRSIAHALEAVVEKPIRQFRGRKLSQQSHTEMRLVHHGSSSSSTGATGPDLYAASSTSPSESLFRSRNSSTGTEVMESSIHPDLNKESAYRPPTAT
jgi:Organic solute transporter Ostalpha